MISSTFYCLTILYLFPFQSHTLEPQNEINDDETIDSLLSAQMKAWSNHHIKSLKSENYWDQVLTDIPDDPSKFISLRLKLIN